MYRVSIGRLGQTVEQVSTALWIPGIQDNDLTDSIPVGIPRLLSEFVRVCTDECGVRPAHLEIASLVGDVENAVHPVSRCI